MGTVKGQRQAGKISISQVVDGTMKVWGWVPDKLPGNGVSRDDVVQAIYDTANTYGQISRWWEFNASRDSRPLDDPREFLSSLLEESGRGSSL